jgi:hypothetical protein
MPSPAAGANHSSSAEPRAHAWHLSSFDRAGSNDAKRAAYQSPAVFGLIELANPHQGIGNIRWHEMACPDYIMGIESVLATNPRKSSREWSLDGVYARGNDLIADYRNQEDGRLTQQTVWSIRTWDGGTGRAQSDLPPDMPLIDTIISLQTESLQAAIEVGVISQLECTEILWIDASDQNRPTRRLQTSHEHASHGMAPLTLERPDCVVYRLGANSEADDSVRNNRLSYVEMARADDFLQWQGKPISTPGSARRGYQSRWISRNDHLEKGVIRRLNLRSLLLPRENDLQLARDCYEEMASASPPLGV